MVGVVDATEVAGLIKAASALRTSETPYPYRNSQVHADVQCGVAVVSGHEHRFSRLLHALFEDIWREGGGTWGLQKWDRSVVRGGYIRVIGVMRVMRGIRLFRVNRIMRLVRVTRVLWSIRATE